MAPKDKKSEDGGASGPQNEGTSPDARGERPTDPNELAKWIVDQSTGDETGDQQTAQ